MTPQITSHTVFVEDPCNYSNIGADKYTSISNELQTIPGTVAVTVNPLVPVIIVPIKPDGDSTLIYEATLFNLLIAPYNTCTNIKHDVYFINPNSTINNFLFSWVNDTTGTT